MVQRPLAVVVSFQPHSGLCLAEDGMLCGSIWFGIYIYIYILYLSVVCDAFVCDNSL